MKPLYILVVIMKLSSGSHGAGGVAVTPFYNLAWCKAAAAAIRAEAPRHGVNWTKAFCVRVEKEEA